jgi:hypothetical protein
VKYLDGAACLLVLEAAVEVGHHAEAAAAVLDDGADGGAPPPLRLLGGVLGRHVEMLLQVPLHGVHWSWRRPGAGFSFSPGRRSGVGGGGRGERGLGWEGENIKKKGGRSLVG